MNWKPLGVLIALAAVGRCYGSFELALILGNGVVNRYDPVNNVTLGSFGFGGLGLLPNRDISLIPTIPGEVAIVDGDGVVRRYEYSTGNYKGGFNAGSGSFGSGGPLTIKALTNGNYVINGYALSGTIGQVSKMYSPTGVLISTMNPFGPTYEPLSSTQGSDGNVYTLNRWYFGGTYYFYSTVFSSNGGYLGQSFVASSASSSELGTIGTSGNSILIGAGWGNPTHQLWKSALGTSQNFSPLLSTGYGGNGWGNLAEAHDGVVHFIQSNNYGTQSNRWYTYDPLLGNSYTAQTLPYNFQLDNMAIVVAPEPESYLAVGLGLIGLVRLRRSRR